MLKTYIFDFDGTIADTLHFALDVVDEFCFKYKLSSTKKDGINTSRESGIVGLFSGLHINASQIKELIDLIKQRESETIHNVDIFPELHNALIELSTKGIVLGVLTSNTENNVCSFLEHHKINVFSFIISEDDAFGKHIILKKIMDEYNFDPNETVYIGDEDRDIKAAKKAGMKSVAVTWGFNSKKLLQSTEPDYLVNSPDDLLDIK